VTSATKYKCTNDFIAWRKQPGGLIGMWMFGAETKDKEKI